MSVPEGKRGESSLQVFIKTEALAVYTTKICSNTKHFKIEYKDSLTSKLIDTAQLIHLKSWEANNIVVNDSTSASTRLSLENDALRLCTDLLALLQIAQKVYHLRAKRFDYWSSLIIECRKLIYKWRESDKRRYSKYK